MHYKAALITKDIEKMSIILDCCRDLKIELLILEEEPTLETLLSHIPLSMVILDFSIDVNVDFEQKVFKPFQNYHPNTSLLISVDKEEAYLNFDRFEVAFDGYLQKPLNPIKTSRILRRAFEHYILKKQLEKEHQYYDVLMLSSIVSKTDLKGRITFVNDNFCSISGFSSDELIGKPHNIVRHPDIPSALYKELWDTVQSGGIWRGRIKNRKKLGGFYIVDAMVMPLLDGEGSIKEYISIRQDITEIEELEARYRQGKERALELHHKQKTLEEINKTKDRFLLLFTHELKTPLNAIVNFTRLMAKETSWSEKRFRPMVESLERNAQTMLSNVENLLNLARLKSGKIRFEIKTFSLKESFNALKKEYASLLKAKNIHLELDVDEMLFIQSDPTAFSHIMTNLISNAIKYGKDTILIKAHVNQEGYFITIEDNGKGIAQTAKVFELFEQGEQETLKRRKTGTGIGLHFAKELCDALGFGISIGTSTTLGGALFTITLKNNDKSRK